MYGLDPTDPRTEQFLRRVLATYRQWGVRWYMMDFVDSTSGSTPGNWPYNGYHDRRLVRGPEVYRRGMRILREAAGEDTYLLASTGPTFQNVGLADAVRTGNDYGDGRPLTRQSGFYPATFVINKPSFWTAYQLTLDGLAANFFIHRKLCLADSASVLTLDKPCPLADAQIAATIFGINGGPMMLGDDVDRMSDERLPLVRKCLPRLPECAVPLDLFETPAPDHPHCFALTCRTAWDQWRLLALFNSGREPLRKTVSFRELGLDPARRCLVWDFWNEQYLGVARDQVSLTVPAGSVKLLRIAPPGPILGCCRPTCTSGRARRRSPRATGTRRPGHFPSPPAGPRGIAGSSSSGRRRDSRSSNRAAYGSPRTAMTNRSSSAPMFNSGQRPAPRSRSVSGRCPARSSDTEHRIFRAALRLRRPVTGEAIEPDTSRPITTGPVAPVRRQVARFNTLPVVTWNYRKLAVDIIFRL